MTNELNTREKKLIVLCVVMAAVVIGLAAALANIIQERDKYQAILDVACEYSGNAAQCRKGLNYFKGMSADSIKNFGR